MRSRYSLARLYDLVPMAVMRLLCSWCNPVCLLYTKSPFPKQNKKEKYNQTSCLHGTQYPYPPLQQISLAMISQNKAFCNNAGLQCSCSQAPLPCCEFNQGLDLTSENSATYALLFSQTEELCQPNSKGVPAQRREYQHQIWQS